MRMEITIMATESFLKEFMATKKNSAILLSTLKSTRKLLVSKPLPQAATIKKGNIKKFLNIDG